jgi:hypothetical protein
MFADDHKHSSGDAVLSTEWLLVSRLCEASARFSLKCNHVFSSLDGKEDVSGRANLCRTILGLLANLPELLPGDPQSVVARYKFKQSVAEQEKALGTEMQQARWTIAEQTDPRLRRQL